MKKNGVLLIAAAALRVFTAVFFAYGADGAGSESVSYISIEIEKIRAEAVKKNAGSKEKHDAYARLGRLLRLSGDIDGAAEAWMSAAYAEKGLRDDGALLEGAACYIAMGEWDKAAANVKVVLVAARADKTVFLRAKYLAAQIDAFRSGDTAILNSMLDDPDYSSARPSLYWTLWKLSGKAEYKAKLLNEFPDSPETRILLSENDKKNAVMESSMPQWILPSGKEVVGLKKTPNADTGSSAKTETDLPPVLQTGVFNSQINAMAHADRLRKAGFDADVIRRRIKETEYWLVTVPAGADLNKTIISLKDAGFSAFPLY
ncbi:MAG: SPOR domain-containing protein [Spirochaetaceae bacterium]|jgi:hypothetical protein|nr:SPOR domain-containing protein [Spirochaetaceae bacterium]